MVYATTTENCQTSLRSYAHGLWSPADQLLDDRTAIPQGKPDLMIANMSTALVVVADK